MRTTSHNYILPKIQTSRFKSVFLIDVLLIVTNICFPLFILLPCKLLRVCLRNEFLIKTFTIIIRSETAYVAYEGMLPSVRPSQENAISSHQVTQSEKAYSRSEIGAGERDSARQRLSIQRNLGLRERLI